MSDHQHSAAVDEAERWLVSLDREKIARPVIPFIRERFGLSLTEAIEAVRQANGRRA